MNEEHGVLLSTEADHELGGVNTRPDSAAVARSFAGIKWIGLISGVLFSALLVVGMMRGSVPVQPAAPNTRDAAGILAPGGRAELAETQFANDDDDDYDNNAEEESEEPDNRLLSRRRKATRRRWTPRRRDNRRRDDRRRATPRRRAVYCGGSISSRRRNGDWKYYTCEDQDSWFTEEDACFYNGSYKKIYNSGQSYDDRKYCTDPQEEDGQCGGCTSGDWSTCNTWVGSTTCTSGNTCESSTSTGYWYHHFDSGTCSDNGCIKPTTSDECSAAVGTWKHYTSFTENIYSGTDYSDYNRCQWYSRTGEVTWYGTHHTNSECGETEYGKQAQCVCMCEAASYCTAS